MAVTGLDDGGVAAIITGRFDVVDRFFAHLFAVTCLRRCAIAIGAALFVPRFLRWWNIGSGQVVKKGAKVTKLKFAFGINW